MNLYYSYTIILLYYSYEFAVWILMSSREFLWIYKIYTAYAFLLESLWINFVLIWMYINLREFIWICSNLYQIVWFVSNLFRIHTNLFRIYTNLFRIYLNIWCHLWHACPRTDLNIVSWNARKLCAPTAVSSLKYSQLLKAFI